MENIATVVTLVTVGFLATSGVKGHGRMIDPPARSSAWRYGFNVPQNTQDMQLNCGGLDVLWQINKGRCGVCGDPYNGPRDNEAGGKYATGTIVRNYSEGQTIHVVLDITVNHGGYSTFKLCPNNDVHRPVTQDCLDHYLLASPSGETRFIHDVTVNVMNVNLVLPRGLVCTQCVLQWKWVANQHNHCNVVTGECCNVIGCGEQEHYYGCADVAITGSMTSFGSLPDGYIAVGN